MRNLLIGILLGLLIAVPVAFTQQQPERIVIGVPLQIGMTKDVVISRIAEQGFKIEKAKDDDMWVISKKTEGSNDYDIVGMFRATDSHISWASRSWTTSADAGATKMARSFYFLVKSFEDTGNTSCSIQTERVDSPNLDNKQLSIRCGKRTAVLYVTVSKDEMPVVSLDEWVE